MESPLQAEILDDTLDYHEDTFDKLLQRRPVLRELKVIKRNVRASFNMDSSVENADSSDSSIIAGCTTNRKPNNLLTVPVQRKTQLAPASTPLSKKSMDNPFRCAISPVGILKLKFSNGTPKNTKLKSKSSSKGKRSTVQPTVSTPNCSNGGQSYAESIVYGESDNSENTEPNQVNDTSSMLDFVFQPKKNQRQVCFKVNDDSSIFLVVPEQNSLDKNSNKQMEKRATELRLAPGKWRKSLHNWRRANYLNISVRRSSVYVRKSENVPAHNNRTVNTAYAAILSGERDWRSGVYEYCNQSGPVSFNELYSEMKLSNCRKLGEGAFGEVFINCKDVKYKKFGIHDIVYKIIPIEGEEEINGEPQKKYETVLPEIVMSTELCCLADTAKSNCTPHFVKINKVNCVQGCYPEHLIALWENYDEQKGSENDHPEIFQENQLFIVLEMAYSGVDMESFEFQNCEQAYYALQQIVYALAIAEQEYQFEHRDLHWGNILILPARQNQIKVKMNNKTFYLLTKGIKVTIIDYTLSRMSLDEGCLYNDLSTDEELFAATGDYQFDIYRMMRDVLNNNWQLYEPKTNIFWISYIIEKLLNGVTYKNTNTKTHELYKRRLLDLQQVVLTFNSAHELTASHFKP